MQMEATRLRPKSSFSSFRDLSEAQGYLQHKLCQHHWTSSTLFPHREVSPTFMALERRVSATTAYVKLSARYLCIRHYQYRRAISVEPPSFTYPSLLTRSPLSWRQQHSPASHNAFHRYSKTNDRKTASFIGHLTNSGSYLYHAVLARVRRSESSHWPKPPYLLLPTPYIRLLQKSANFLPGSNIRSMA